MKKVIMALGLFICFTVILSLATQAYVRKSTEIDAQIKKPAPIIKSLKNATYTVGTRSITLQNGMADIPLEKSAVHILTKYLGFETTGDLDGDLRADTAFILTQSEGGSGTFYYVAVGFDTPKVYRGSNTVLLGDRITPQSITIKGERLAVKYLDRKKGQPMTTAPSVTAIKYIDVKSGRLVEVK